MCQRRFKSASRASTHGMSMGIGFTLIKTSLVVTLVQFCYEVALYELPLNRVPIPCVAVAKSRSEERIPRIIHQTYKTLDVPDKWKETQASVKRLHPGYKYMFWTDADIETFMMERYPWFMPIMNSYPYKIQKVDAFRYFALYDYGGIYMDLDIGSRQSLDCLLHHEAVLPETDPIGFSNDFMAFSQGHPFLFELITNLASASRRITFPPYIRVIGSTGPLFVTMQYYGVNRKMSSLISTLPQDLYSSDIALTYHVQGASWHTPDAFYLGSVYLYWRDFLPWVIGALVILYLVQRKLRRVFDDGEAPFVNGAPVTQSRMKHDSRKTS